MGLMLWIVPLLVMFMILWAIVLIIGIPLTLSGDYQHPTVKRVREHAQGTIETGTKTEAKPKKVEVKKEVESEVEKTAYIELNGQFFELVTKAEVKKAIKDGYKIVYK